MRKLKPRYRYRAYDRDGKHILSSNDLWWIFGECEALNLELRKRLPNVKVGKKLYENRYTIVRQITNQLRFL